MNKSLIDKFKNDIKKRSRAKRLLLVFDQFLNVLIWNGSQDETVSSHIYRRKAEGRATKFDIWLCRMLQKLESSHCKKSLGE